MNTSTISQTIGSRINLAIVSNGSVSSREIQSISMDVAGSDDVIRVGSSFADAFLNGFKGNMDKYGIVGVSASQAIMSAPDEARDSVESIETIIEASASKSGETFQKDEIATMANLAYGILHRPVA